MKDILVVTESWTSEDERQGYPLAGKGGELLCKLFQEAELDPDQCQITSVVSGVVDISSLFYSTQETKQTSRTLIRGLYPRPELISALASLTNKVEEAQPRLIIGFGSLTLWALTENSFTISATGGKHIPSGIRLYRGSMLRTRPDLGSVPFLPTYSPTETWKNYPLRAMLRHDLKSRVPAALESRWDPPEPTYHVRPSFELVSSYLSALIISAPQSPLTLACDIETRSGFIACLGLAWSKTDALCIPLLTTERRKKAGYWSFEDEAVILVLLRHLPTMPRVNLVGHNFAYDIQYIFNELLCLPRVTDDTMLKHHICYPGGGNPLQKTGPQGLVQKSLNHISSLYNEYHVYWKDEGKSWDTSMPEEQLWKYNCRDCCATFEVNQALSKVIDQESMVEQYLFQIEQLNLLAIPMMLRGIKVNTEARSQMQMELLDAIAEYESRIQDIIPESFELPKSAAPWFRSPKQLNHIFYTVLGIKPILGKTGRPTTDKSALPILAKREPIVAPLVEVIGKLRSLGVFYGNFLTASLDPDNRMRCSFNVSGTETFRWSSNENPYGRGTNLQNIPKGDDESKVEEIRANHGVVFPNVRRLFVPDKDYLIIDADLSGADAQVVAWESGEVEWKEALKQGIKLHSVISIEREGTDGYPYYDIYKRRIHATNYGGGARNLTQIFRGLYGESYTSESKEREFQEYWFDRFPGIKHWHERIGQSLRDTGGVANQFGNRVRYVDRLDRVFTQALAWIPQSTVALVCLRGGLALRSAFPWAQILLQVHDSIVFQIPQQYESRLPEIQQVLNSVSVPYPSDPLFIPWGMQISKKSWGDCKG